jgi:hypothetical protein
MPSVSVVPASTGGALSIRSLRLPLTEKSNASGTPILAGTRKKKFESGLGSLNGGYSPNAWLKPSASLSKLNVCSA